MRTKNEEILSRLNTLLEVGYVDRATLDRYQRNLDCRGWMNYVNRRWGLWQREYTQKLLDKSNAEIEQQERELKELMK